jgi:hypothetical protein
LIRTASYTIMMMNVAESFNNVLRGFGHSRYVP